MTQEQNTKLLQAYRAAISAGQDGIADMLEDVILEKMGPKSPVMREVALTPAKLSNEAMCELLYGPANEMMGAKAEWTGIDHLSKETTA